MKPRTKKVVQKNTKSKGSSSIVLDVMDSANVVSGFTSEGYRIIGGIAYDESDNPMYPVDADDDDDDFYVDNDPFNNLF